MYTDVVQTPSRGGLSYSVLYVLGMTSGYCKGQCCTLAPGRQCLVAIPSVFLVTENASLHKGKGFRSTDVHSGGHMCLSPSVVQLRGGRPEPRVSCWLPLSAAGGVPLGRALLLPLGGVALIPRSTGREKLKALPSSTLLPHGGGSRHKQFFRLNRCVKEICFLPVRQVVSQSSLPYHCKAHGTATSLNSTPEGSEVGVCDDTDLIPKVWVRLANRFEIVHLQHQIGLVNQ